MINKKFLDILAKNHDGLTQITTIKVELICDLYDQISKEIIENLHNTKDEFKEQIEENFNNLCQENNFLRENFQNLKKINKNLKNQFNSTEDSIAQAQITLNKLEKENMLLKSELINVIKSKKSIIQTTNTDLLTYKMLISQLTSDVKNIE